MCSSVGAERIATATAGSDSDSPVGRPPLLSPVAGRREGCHKDPDATLSAGLPARPRPALKTPIDGGPPRVKTPKRASRPAAPLDEAAVAGALHEIYVPGAETRLRSEEAQKVREIAPLLEEVDSALRRRPADRPLVLVDAAAGRGYVSLISARLLLGPAGRPFRWLVIEREQRRADAVRSLAERDGFGASFEVICADVGDPTAWPDAPDLVVALHACGPAADAVIDRATASSAAALLLVPCCVSKTVAAHATAAAAAESLAIPRHAPVRRRFLESIIAAERTLLLESRGYQTEVVEFCPPRVTPHNLLWRCRRVAEPIRARRAADSLARLRTPRPWIEPLQDG